MRSSETSIRCACATARLYSVFLLERISARNLSFSPAAGAIVSLVGGSVSLVGASLLSAGASLLLVGASLLLVGASLLLVGATALLRTGAPPPPPSSSSINGTSLRRCIQRSSSISM